MSDTITTCPHTGSTLHRDPGAGADFLRSPEGILYYKNARSLDYGADYFLDEYKNQYGRTYVEDEKQLRELARRRLNVLKKVDASASGRLLEIGCAAGFFLDEARSSGFEVRGLDISEFAVAYARDSLGLDARAGSFLDEANPGAGSWDALAAFYVIEHFPDQRLVFERISSLLGPGGLFVFAVPSTNGPTYTTSPEVWAGTHPTDHFADYSPAALKKILPLYGLELVHVRPASYHPTRLRGKAPWRWILRRNPKLYRRYADFFNFGDTMEVIARKKNPRI